MMDKIGLWVICILFCALQSKAEIFYVTNTLEFISAHDSAEMGDTIVWPDGVYSNIRMEIAKDHLFIMAENLGKTIFTGNSRVDIMGDYITLQGVQFLDGDVGSNDVINTRGSYNVFTQINIRAYRSYKYLRVRESSQYCEITYCNFENRLNLDDQNILSILVSSSHPGYHKIQHCSFKNFDGSGNDLGIEPIRIGVSSQANRISRTLVEYCYFTKCNGDGEIISSKATQNVYRHNTFENNPLAELVLRHGSEAIVYGNFFINNLGGVRVREGQDHYIYNNYFVDLGARPIYLQNEASDPLDNINIAYNTIVNCGEVRLGGSGNNKPTNVTFANNIFSDPDDNLFERQTGTETWISNIAFGPLGIPLPDEGVDSVDPLLNTNSEGYLGLSLGSPAIDAASGGYEAIPNFEGIDGIDTEILFDLMGQNRPQDIEERDLGCSEFPEEILIQPIATEDNTGPTYETSPVSSIDYQAFAEDIVLNISPNPVSDMLNIEIESENIELVKMDIFDMKGHEVTTISELATTVDNISLNHDVKSLPQGLYVIRLLVKDVQRDIIGYQSVTFIKY